MADSLKIDVERFASRLQHFYAFWKKRGEGMGDIDSVVLVNGPLEDNPYRKISALYFHFFGLMEELPNTLLAFTADTMYILAGGQKAAVFEPLQASAMSDINVVVLTRNKTDKDAANLQQIIDKMKTSHTGKNYGTLAKDHKGQLGEAWKAAIAGKEIAEVDISQILSHVLAVKLPEEQQLARKASQATLAMFSKLRSQLLDIIDKGTKTSHLALAESIEDKIAEIANAMGVTKEDLESCYTPIIQSRKYDLKASASSDESSIFVPSNGVTPSVIVCSIGVRYRLFCSNLTRTFIVNASGEHKAMYQALLKTYDTCRGMFVPGTKLRNIYKRCLDTMRQEDAPLSKLIIKSIGWGMGHEFRETAYSITEKNDREIQAGMIFTLSIGVQDITLESKQFSMQIADTILVTEAGPECLTDGAHRNFKKIAWQLGDDADQQAAEPDWDEEQLAKVLKERELRKTEESAVNQERERIAQAQQELKRQQALQRQQQAGAAVKQAMKDFKPENVKAYEDPSQFPAILSERRIHVDFDHDAVIVPLNGTPVPFHIATIKNATKNEQPSGVVMRLNFHAPGSGSALSSYDPATLQKCFLKELRFRTLDPQGFGTAIRNINELKKRYTMRMQDARDKASIVQQADLILSKTNPPKLQALKVFPNPVPRQRKLRGNLEAHVNGFRFVCGSGGEKIDIIYANIRHAFLQKALKNSREILISFHLHSPIMVGNLKTQDVTVWVEYMEEAESTEGRRVMHGDADELMDEQRQMEIKHKLEREFGKFVDAVEPTMVAKNGPQFDALYDDLLFSGCPANETVDLVPTDSCLICITKRPVFVLSVADIEIAYFERISAASGLTSKNFDIAFVLNTMWDENVPPAKCFKRICSIDINMHDKIHGWLTFKQIRCFAGNTPVLWPDVLRDIRKSGREQFLADGGWDVLEEEDEEEHDEEDEDEDPEFSQPSDEYSESDDDSEDFSEYSDEDSASGEELGSDESEGMDAEEMERWGRMQDKERGLYDDRPTKKKRDDYSEDESSEDDRKKKPSSASKPGVKKPAPPPSRGGSASGGKPSSSSSSGPSKNGPLKPGASKPSSSSSSSAMRPGASSSSSKPSASSSGKPSSSSSSGKPSSSSSSGKPSSSSSSSAKPGMSKPSSSSSSSSKPSGGSGSSFQKFAAPSRK